MQHDREASLAVRAAIHSQVERLEADCRAMTIPALHEAVDAIRAVALANELYAVEGIARAFERSIARDRSMAVCALYFDQLKLATGCSAAEGPAAREAMLAAISVRMAG